MLESCIYRGTIRHRRYLPRRHDFRYPLFMMYLDLDELERVFENSSLFSVERRAPASFYRRDHLGEPVEPLQRSIRTLIEQRTGRSFEGPIRLLTHLRYFGYVFNPVSFYFCFGPQPGQVLFIVAEVHNTPWNERYCYVLEVSEDAAAEGRSAHEFCKDFHVSPFMDMSQQYRWQFAHPGDRLLIHMQNFEQEQLFFDATLDLNRREISNSSLQWALFSYPFLTVRVIGAIYWNAFLLWWKGCTFYSHPSKRRAEEEGTR